MINSDTIPNIIQQGNILFIRVGFNEVGKSVKYIVISLNGIASLSTIYTLDEIKLKYPDAKSVTITTNIIN